MSTPPKSHAWAKRLKRLQTFVTADQSRNRTEQTDACVGLEAGVARCQLIRAERVRLLPTITIRNHKAVRPRSCSK